MSTEAKVGAFVVAGLVFMGIAVFLLGDFTFEKRYILYVEFADVTGLSDKAPVKLSGVAVGKVTGVELIDSKARVVAAISKDVPVYRDAVFSIGSTGIIGSKFLQIDQGKPSSGILPPGSTVRGEAAVSIEKALAKALGSLQELLGGLNGEEDKQGALAKNLNATIANVRGLTANLAEMMADTKPAMTRTLNRMDDITAKLDSILARTDEMMAAINSAKGPVGAMLHDEKMKNEVKETVTSLKETAGSVKDILGRVTQFRVFWNYDWRYEHAIRASRGDIGLKIYPSGNRYYYLGGSNLGNNSDSNRYGVDYAKKNTVDGLLGFDWRFVDFGVGVLRSGGGARVSLKPFAEAANEMVKSVRLIGEGYDFGRNRVVEGRSFNKPHLNVAAQFRPHKLIGLGARIEDLREVSRYQSWVNVSFEDKDIAYLFGMVSFGAAGTKGRSKK